MAFGVEPLHLAAVMALWFQARSHPQARQALVWASFGILFALERFFARRSDWIASPGETLSDLSYKLWGVLLLFPFVDPAAVEPLSGALARLRSDLGSQLWPCSWPLLARVALFLLVADFFNYWFHRLQHRLGFLWRTHATHHSSAKLCWSKALINHPIELVILLGIFGLPVALFGAGDEELAGAALFSVVVQLFAHSNLPLSARPLGWVLNMNRYHARHHSLRLREASSNFGCALILWDRVFGTFREGPAVDRVGIASGAALSLGQQLWLPFQRPEDSLPLSDPQPVASLAGPLTAGA